MNRKVKVFGGLILVVLFLLVLGSWYVKTQNEKMYDDSLMSTYNYRISITGNSSLKNVTLYLPVPVFENESDIGMEIVNGDYYDKPLDWNLSLEDAGNGLMLKIEAAEIQPVYHSLPVAVPETESGSDDINSETYEEEQIVESHEYSEETPVLVSFDFGTSVEADHVINTKYPAGNEPMLLPKNNLRESEEGSPVPLPKNINPEYFDYESLVYARYDSSPDSDVQIFIELEGRNEWWIYGWQYNEYIDRIPIQLTGPQEGWVQAGGKLTTGDGVYRE